MRGRTKQLYKMKKEKAKELFGKGCSALQVKLRLGVSKATASLWQREWKKENGIQGRPKD